MYLNLIFIFKTSIFFQCFEKHNLPINNQNDHSLCALEMKSHMYAAVDSKTCIRRTILSNQNTRPSK